MPIGSESTRILRRPLTTVASESPEVLARRLLKSRPARNRHAQDNIWPQLQDLSSDAVIKRASQVLARTRSASELQAVLNAASADAWTETGAAIARRLDRELAALGSRVPSKVQLQKLEALCTAAGNLGVNLDVNALRALLKHRSARLRSAAAQYARKLHRADLHALMLPLSAERGTLGAAASEFLRELGDGEAAAALWPRALAARRSGNTRLLYHYLNLLGACGAFDILVALRVWVEEDFAKSEAAGWNLAESWTLLCRSRLVAGDCTCGEAVDALRWFLHTAEKQAIPELKLEGEGVFHLARGFALLGENADAARLARMAAKRSLPNPDKFPELLPLTRDAVAAASAPTSWLAAAGDIDAQRKVVENWPVLLREGRKPVNWDLRGSLSADVLAGVLREALNTPSAVSVRRVLKFICGDAAARAVQPEVARLAASHPSEIVRWKAARVGVLASASQSPAAEARFTRLDAVVLSGAPRKVDEPRRTAPRAEKIAPGLVAPDRPGHGWKLDFEKLRPAAREQTVQAILKAPLERALHRRAPLGPAYEERPDVREVRELAAPAGSVDEQMAESARAVMDFWVFGEEPLTLDLSGITQIAAFLSTPGVTMDDDDVAACGAFIGETLRKRFGGEWSGFDSAYLLHIKDESFDPIGLARRIFERKDIYQGSVTASEMYVGAESRVGPPRRPGVNRDTGASFERAIRALCELPPGAPMSALLAETRIFTYRMEPADWSAVLAACDTLLENQSGARIAAAVAVYAPGCELARAWARWGSRRREACGLLGSLAEAMEAAADHDDLEAMPEWTLQVPAPRFSFLNALRKRMPAAAWKKTLLLLLRQRASAGDSGGVGWGLFSYKYEHRDCLPLLAAFCEMAVASRQTLLRATRHCTRNETKLFRPLWAEALRDAAPAVVLAALDAIVINRARSLRPLVESLKNDARETVRTTANAVLENFSAK